MIEQKIRLTRRTSILPGYPPEFNEEFKRYIRKRDRFLCAVCNKRIPLDIHHIDYIKKNTTRLNCVSLCRDCHRHIHWSSWFDRMMWKHRLWDLVGKRETQYVCESD